MPFPIDNLMTMFQPHIIESHWNTLSSVDFTGANKSVLLCSMLLTPCGKVEEEYTSRDETIRD